MLGEQTGLQKSATTQSLGQPQHLYIKEKKITCWGSFDRTGDVSKSKKFYVFDLIEHHVCI